MQPKNRARYSRAIVQQQYSVARRNLLLMILLTIFNLVLLAFESGTMMLFSATVPYYAVLIGVVSENSAVLTVCIVLTVLILALYILCWLMSKKHYGWLIGALVLFALDTVAMLFIYVILLEFSGVMDAAIHVVVLYYLILGVRSGYQLRTVPEDGWAESICKQDGDQTDSVPQPYPADMSVKARILLEAEVSEYRICYRRVKKVNELVVNGLVYDSVVMGGLESAHVLSAQIDGKLIQVGLDSVGYSYLSVDGVQITRKLRLW